MLYKFDLFVSQKKKGSLRGWEDVKESINFVYILHNKVVNEVINEQFLQMYY